jgi:small subunit ribosomal protein S12|uniref:ribosomal protein S12 n=1 Tax=Thecamoeba quadrilineata TaxID=343530 RepID=UPI00226C7C5B|nr:ribosomal protein S12 [Thecamoeba quadrilineata]UZN43855.1 ribosomal protein S12 [Thecamoeba quadrilineata]
MPTYNQIGRGKRIVKIKKKNRAGALKGAPHKKGICVKIMIMSPKKPNSAKRKITKVKISKYRKINCYIPGQGHDLREYSVVLIRGGRVKDLPGIQYHLVKGKFDFSCWERETRKNRRSIYGIPKDKNS